MTTISIFKDNDNYGTFANATQLSIGSKLVYIEYVENNQTRIRAFGKAEFDRVEIEKEDGTKSIIQLGGNEFHKVDAKFRAEYSFEEFERTPEEETY